MVVEVTRHQITQTVVPHNTTVGKVHRKVVSDSIFMTTGNLFLKLKNIVLLPIIISTVGMAGYGAYLQIMINVELITPICTLAGLGFYRYTSKYTDDEREDLSRDFWTVICSALLFSCVGAAVIYLSAPLISRTILNHQYVNSVRLSSAFVGTASILEVTMKYLQARKRFKLAVVYNLLCSLLPYLGLIVGILLTSDIFFGLLFALTLDSLLIATLMLLTLRQLNFVFPTWSRFYKFAQYSWPLVFSGLSGGLLAKADRYFIGYFWGPSSIGVYGVVFSACELLRTLVIPFVQYFQVYLPKAWDDGKTQLVMSQLRTGLGYYLALSIGGLAGLTLYLKPVLQRLLGQATPDVENLELLVLAIGLGMLSLGTTTFFYHIIRYREITHYQIIFQFAGVAANVVLNFLLVPRYGIIGAGIATFFSYTAILIACNQMFSLSLGLHFGRKIVRTVLASTAILVIFSVTDTDGLATLSSSIFLSTLLYFLLLVLLRVVSWSDLKEAVS